MMPFIQLSAAPTLSLCASRQVYAKIDDALKKMSYCRWKFEALFYLQVIFNLHLTYCSECSRVCLFYGYILEYFDLSYFPFLN